jgi:hypothetical protein
VNSVSSNSTVKRRMSWQHVVPFPGNPVYEGRLRTMRREWNGYDHRIVGSPAIFDNSAGAYPDLPEDTLIVGDGNHRRALAEQDGKLDAEFIADLYRGLSRAEMHRLRRGLNDRRTVKPAEVFLERFEEGDTTKRAIKSRVEKLGWQITHERADGGLSCTNELEWIFARDKNAMVHAIATYEACWGKREAREQARVIKGLGAFWIKYPHADEARLWKCMSGQSVADLYRAGKSSADDLPFIKSVYDGIRYVLVMNYNRGRRSGLLKP